MKPIKQNVFVPVKVEDIQAQLRDGYTYIVKDETGNVHQHYWNEDDGFYAPKGKKVLEVIVEQECYFFTPEQLNQFVSDIIKNTLETAAEKSLVIQKCNHYHSGETKYTDKSDEVFVTVRNDNSYDEHHCISVDKQSITNTFEQTFNKHKV